MREPQPDFSKTNLDVLLETANDGGCQAVSKGEQGVRDGTPSVFVALDDSLPASPDRAPLRAGQVDHPEQTVDRLDAPSEAATDPVDIRHYVCCPT